MSLNMYENIKCNINIIDIELLKLMWPHCNARAFFQSPYIMTARDSAMDEDVQEVQVAELLVEYSSGDPSTDQVEVKFLPHLGLIMPSPSLVVKGLE